MTAVFEIRNAGFRYQKGAAGVDLIHQIVAFHLGIQSSRWAYSTGVISARQRAKQLTQNGEIGGSCWVRTSDQLVKSQLLYRLS